MRGHHIMLSIINHPGASQEYLSMINNCHQTLIAYYMKKLNIEPSKKPRECRG